jgi:hypothetical protein
MGAARKPVLPVMVVCCVLVGWLVWSAAPALALVKHEYLTQLTGFQNPVGLAIGSNSDLYVADEGGKTIDRFDSSHGPLAFSAVESYVEGNKLTGTPTGAGGSVVQFADPTDVALNETTGEIYVVDAGMQVVDIFTSSGEYLTQLIPGSSMKRLAINQATGDVYMEVASGLMVFDSLNKYVGESEPAPKISEKATNWYFGDVAVDGQTGNVYFDPASQGAGGAVQLYSASEIVSGAPVETSAPEFTGMETPLGYFDPFASQFSRIALNQGTGQLFFLDEWSKVVDEFADSSEEVYEGQLTGPFTKPQAVAIDPSSGDVYVADASGVVDVFGPDMQVAPVVEDQAVSATTSDSAKLSALVITGKEPATYHFEYETGGTGSKSKTPSLTVRGNHYISAEVGGLTPDTEYHFRLVAENSVGVSTTTISTFRTLPVPLDLLDDRVYEMVTPIDKEDAEVYVPMTENIGNVGENYGTLHPSRPASDGNAVVYEADPTHSGGGESSGNGIGSAYLATRSPEGGWSQASIQPPGRRGTYYLGFSSDLSVGVLESATENPLYEEPPLPGAKAPRDPCVGREYAPRGECDVLDLYRHTLGEESYQSLYSATPMRSIGEFSGIVPSGELGDPMAPAYAGGSTDMSELLFEANDALLEGKGALETELDEDVEQEIKEGRANYAYLYDSNRGTPVLVDVLPDGHIARDAVFGAPHVEGVQSGANPPDFSHVISANGSRVFWTALEGQSPKALYIRENPTQPQSPVNAQEQCTVSTDACTIQIDKEVGGAGRFWTASNDGSKVFFTSETGELYEYQVNPVVGQPGVLSDLTPSIEVQGLLGTSEDDDYIYYVDGTGELYMLHYDGSEWEAPVSIATLSGQDGDEVQPMSGYNTNNVEPKVGDWVPDIGQRTAEVTPDGEGLAFVSNQSLKVQGFPNGYKNEGHEEVYVYDAISKTLFCASCSQTDEPGSSGFLPVSWQDTYVPTLVSEDGGRVFFDSNSALVSRDTNGVRDVYEWEREGVGTCGPGQGADGGCLSLLTGGSSADPSTLLGASVNGRDVFVITRADLTPEADDELFKVFDARVDGAVAPTPPACTGTGCQGIPAAAPTFATPSSVTFEGVGNFPPAVPGAALKAKTKPLTRTQKLARALRSCRAKLKKQRASCETTARRSYGTKGKAKQSSSKKERTK